MLNTSNLPLGGKLLFLLVSLFVLTQFLVLTNAYKLNVPKVLLPFHSTKLITFQLEADGDTDPSNHNEDNLCFVWSSSRPDVVTITPIYDSSSKKTSECSNKATVSAVSKHPQRLTSIILAKETKTDKLIRCDVIVDRIHKIRIKHTTTHLYLEDSPESFTAEALDSESNTFSSLDGLPFEWSVINDVNDNNNNNNNLTLDSRNVLRISKFIESEYQVSESIRQLESIGLSGHKILIEGLKTGTANVQAKLLDSFYKESLKTPLVRLLVVANILIEPSYPVYILVGAYVKYSVFLIKQTNIEKIILPSLQYYFESRNKTTADLVDYGLEKGVGDASTIVGLSVGSVEVTLIDRNMKEPLFVKTSDQLTNVESKVLVPPPTALVHVVHADHLYFEIKNWKSSWILEVGRTYEIMILVNTAQRNQIYPSDNLKIESMFDTNKFRINQKSKNGSYHILTVLEKGQTQAHASLKGTIQPGDTFKSFEFVARGEQDMELLDPIDVKPKLLIFAFFPSSLGNEYSPAYEYLLVATGGSESYYWKSLNSTIATVSQQGMVKTTASRLGKSQVLVSDTRNIDIFAKSLVYILEPVDLQLLGCPVETQLGNKLYVNIEMNANLNSIDESDIAELSLGAFGQKLVPISDCSRLKFEVIIKDEKMFRFLGIQSPSAIHASNKNHPIKNACAVIVLDALQVGRTSIVISASTVSQSGGALASSFEQTIKLQSNELLIGSYSQLKSQKTQITLARDSSLVINLNDGPLISSDKSVDSSSSLSSTYYSQLTSISDESFVDVMPIESDYQPNRYSFRVKCKKDYELDPKQQTDYLVNVKFSIWHKQTSSNKCPVVFDYNIEVRCARPHSLQLNQLLVNNEESKINQVSMITKWKCPIKLSSNLIVAHLERPLLVQMLVKDALNNIFDNFTSLHVEWEISNKNMLETVTNIQSVELSALEDRTGLTMLAETGNSFQKQSRDRFFYQVFAVHSKSIKKHENHLKLTGKLYLDANDYKKSLFLSKTLTVNFVSLAKIYPDSMTIFNHPSNIITLALSNGSGHFQAEIETVKGEQTNEIDLGNRLKINQITEHSIVVSPLVNNGLTLLHIYDYCIPPFNDFLSRADAPQLSKSELIFWQPASTARINVAGINSILVHYEDEKFQVNTQLKIYVQISDANGNSIKVKYFSLMSLKAKLINSQVASTEKGSESSYDKSNNGNKSSNKNILLENESYASIEALPLEEYSKLDLSDEDKEFTAVYTLNALKEGIVSIQFEAHSDGYFENSKLASTMSKLIKSPFKDIQIFEPLNVQPKYIELIRGANYQIVTNGGPNTPDSSIQFEMLPTVTDKKQKKIIEINSDRIIEALDEGQIKVVAKSMGHACLPFSKESTILRVSSFRCNSEHRVSRVYSEDFLIVKVVELRSIHIQAPIKSIKRGNEMQIYLMGNEHQLNPLNFGSCANLKYTWKVNDHEVATLYHPLLEDAKMAGFDTDSYSIFENSFSLRFFARKSGNVKVTVTVEFRNNERKGSLYHQLTDSIDINVFENAYLTHFPFSYFAFKNPSVFTLKNKADFFQITQMQQQQNVVLMSPGAQLQVKTNLDKLARKINYELAFFDDQITSKNDNKYCNNNTIIVSQEGIITTARLGQYELKNFEQCTASLLITIEVMQAQQQLIKKQTLLYTIKLKPISYSMIKISNKASGSKIPLMRSNSDPVSFSSNKFKLNTNSLINTKLTLSDTSGTQIKWHVKYYDNLGDVFDVVNLNNEYTLNRNDLIDFSNLNSNLFINAYTNKGKISTLSSQSSSSNLKDDNMNEKTLKSSQQSSFKVHPLILLSNANENSFSTRIVKAGRFIMELTPFASSLKQARDYLGLNIEKINANLDIDSFGGLARLETNVGDILCLSNINPSTNEDDYSSDEENQNNYDDDSKKGSKWLSQSPSIVKLVSEEMTSLENVDFGICLNKGSTSVTKSNYDYSNLIEVNVKPISSIKFSKRNSVKYLTNLIENDQQQNQIQFIVNSGALNLNLNCTDQFEAFLKEKKATGWTKLNEFIPFKCSAGLYTQSDKQLIYMNRLLSSDVTFYEQHWTCNLSFVQNSNVLLYELLERNIDEPTNGETKHTLDEINRANEPTVVRIYVEGKLNHEGDDIKSSQYFELPFFPAFLVQSKQIELPIIAKRSYTSESNVYSADAFNLIVKATRQLHSHLVLTTNSPNFVKIKQIKAKQQSALNKETDSILAISYEISSIQTEFDFNAFASLMEQQNGHLYVQITCSLTQQIERIPIRFLAPGNIGLKYLSNEYVQGEQTSSGRCRSNWLVCNWFKWIVDLTTNQMTTFLIMLSLFFISLVYLLRNTKSSAQRAAERIALNASAAAAAVVAANSYRPNGSPLKDQGSFNPYRYFSPDPTQVTGHLNMSNSDRSPNNLSFRSNRTFKTEPGEPRSNYLSLSPRANQSPLNRSRLNANDRDGVTLYSVNSDNQQFNETNYPFNRNLNQTYDSSDNEDGRVPPRPRYA